MYHAIKLYKVEVERKKSKLFYCEVFSEKINLILIDYDSMLSVFYCVHPFNRKKMMSQT